MKLVTKKVIETSHFSKLINGTKETVLLFGIFTLKK